MLLFYSHQTDTKVQPSPLGSRCSQGPASCEDKLYHSNSSGMYLVDLGGDNGAEEEARGPSKKQKSHH